jgi:hypothetical protein
MKSLDGKRIIRVSDEKAAELYHNGEAHYISKSEWKEKVRDIEHTHNKEEHNHSNKKKSNKMSKAAKRHIKKANK